ncbi:hypothetical protein FACS1894178_1130 [Bacteroidia bacterium]|nr:hypothetical protein FACS1894178_1130 [Bacteroidia bacterium]
MKNYWFIISSKVYFVEKHGNALLYHTENGNFIKVKNGKILALLQKMHERQNLGVIEIDENLIKDVDVYDFINQSISKQICKLVEKKANYPKPVQLMPVLNLQRDVEKLKKETDRSVGEDVLKYLSEITLHLLDKDETLDFNSVKKILKVLKFASNRKIILTGINVFDYQYFNDLLTFLRAEKIEASFAFNSTNLNSKKIKELSDFKKEISVNFPLDIDILTKIMPFSDEKTTFGFTITSEENYRATEKLIEQLKIKNYNISAYYTGENEVFFKENIYPNESDILNGKLSQRVIFAHQKLNTNFFGALYIFPNGDVKANPNTAVLGNLDDFSILQLAEKELLTNTAWRKIRDEKPCCDCLYQYLCPSPSNYEFEIGKANLCNVL